jgi:hypothetical protein
MNLDWRIWLLIIVIALGGIYLRSWQCVEMFPDANRLACMLWK